MINANDGGANISFNGGASWSTQQNQPTAQFYRVITDNQFPYNVYGGQQDNSSMGISSRTNGPGIGWQDWFTGPGCESAYIAFDNPKEPKLIYGGCEFVVAQGGFRRSKRNLNVFGHWFVSF